MSERNDPNVADFNLPSINTGIGICANACGTAGEKTICVKVNCEMSVKEAYRLAATISEAVEWLERHEKDCMVCDDRFICPASKVRP